MDFLGHLVDAPVANILIVAGLLFLGIGAVGKVTGKIEPDKMGRMMASLLGLVLMTIGLVVHVKGDFPKTSVSVQPVVRFFSVTPPQVTKGGNVTISWEVSNADEVELEPFGQVPLTGDRVVQPQLTTIYKLNATSKDGGKSGTFQEVIVSEPKPRETARTKTSNLPTTHHQPDEDNSTPTENHDARDDAVYASQPPPPLPNYLQPPDPGGNSRWTPGSWYYDSGQSDYYWVPGAWVTPPNGEVWTPPYWEYEYGRGRYRWHAGYWCQRVGFYGGIDYGFGYFGSGYYRSANKSRNRVCYNGGPGGIQQRPTSRELAANQDRTPALDVQTYLARDAKNNREQHSKVNHGRPLIVVAANLPDPTPLPRPIPTPPRPSPRPKPVPTPPHPSPQPKPVPIPPHPLPQPRPIPTPPRPLPRPKPVPTPPHPLPQPHPSAKIS